MTNVTADRVVVELEARLDRYDANVRGAQRTFDDATTNIEKSATRAEGAHNRLTLAANNNRVAMLEFGHIARGSIDQLASGAGPVQVFAQHIASLGQAVGLAGGTFGAVGAFLSGPWGLALTAAAAGVAILISKHHDETDTLQAAIEKRQKHQHETELSERADAIWSKTLDGLIQRQKDLNEQLGHRLELQPVVDARAYAAAQQSVEKLGRALDEAENDPSVSPERLQKLEKAFHDAVRAAYQYTLVTGRQEGQALSDLSDKASQWADRQQDIIDRLQGYHPELQALGGQLNAAFGLVKKAVTDAAGANVPFDAFTQRIDALNNKLLDSPQSANAYIAGLRKIAAELEHTVAVAKEAAKVDPIAQFKSSVIGAEGVGPNRLGSSAAGFGQFMPSTWESYFKKLFPQQADGLTKAAIDDLRSNREVATAVIEAATKDYVKVLENAGQQISAAALYTVHLLGQRDALKLLNAPAGENTRDFLSPKVLAGNPFLRGTAGAARNAIAGRIGDSSAAVSSASASIAKGQDELWQRIHEETEKALNTEQKVTLEKGSQSEFAQEILHSGENLNELIRTGILPGLQDWNKEYDYIKSSQQALAEAGAQLVDVLFNPDNWTSWGNLGKAVLKEIEMEFLRLAVINPIKNALFGGSGNGGGLLPTLFGAILGGLGKGAAPVAPHASGGDVSPGTLYRVNETGIEGFQPAQSGKIIPLGRMRGASQGNTIVQQTFVLDARYGITTPELLRHVNTIATTRAAQAGKGAFDASQRAAPGRFQKLQKLGT